MCVCVCVCVCLCALERFIVVQAVSESVTAHDRVQEEGNSSMAAPPASVVEVGALC